MNSCMYCGELKNARPMWLTFFWPERITSLCATCASSFHLLTEQGCPTCMKQAESDTCSDCLQWETSDYQAVLDRNVSLYSYDHFMRDYVAQWKYRGDYALGKVFEHSFQQLFQQHFSNQQYVAVPIPLSDERMQERGFNQAAELADFTGATTIEALGRKHGEKQSKRSKWDRMKADNPFYLSGEVPQYAVLVDDIYTTGTTLRHAAQVLKENGARKIAACTLIRG
jgi:competence protein ComFC